MQPALCRLHQPSFLQYDLIVWGGTYASYIEPKLLKKAVRALFSLVCHPLFLSLMIVDFSNSPGFFNPDLWCLFLNLPTKLHLVAFITFSYSMHLFINIPQDRPVKVIYVYSEETVFNMVLNQFAILVLNSGILYLTVMLHLKYHLNHN